MTQRDEHPIPGNCAEVETLCHLDEFVRVVRQGTKGAAKVLVVTVALNLLLGESWGPCYECKTLLELLRKRYKIRTLYFGQVSPGTGKSSRL
jgi:hypothetical protein